MKKDATVFILLGQSNAVGHGIPMEEKDIIKAPLQNVFGLSRKKNQSFDSAALVWEGYQSAGMNLAEEQDNTYSVANCLAASWQKRIDEGETLPDLYIIQIAIGAQGVTDTYMWYPEREKKLVPGPLGTVDISLYPFTMHILSLLKRSFESMGKSYDIMGIHWRGGENDAGVPVAELKMNLRGIYDTIFTGFYQALGEVPPVILHNFICKDRCLFMDPTGASVKSLEFINELFLELAEEHENISVFDIRRAPHYTGEGREQGIYIEDAVHYTPETNAWVAEDILETYIF